MMKLQGAINIDSSSSTVASKAGFKWTEVKSALMNLPLKYVTFQDHYIFVVSDQIDSTIEGEPHLGLQLWFSLRTGKVISRIWGQGSNSMEKFEIEIFCFKTGLRCRLAKC